MRLPMAAAAEPAPAPGKLDPADVVGELDEELVCTLCRDVLRQPHSCQAGHSFCKDCIAEWLGRSRTCPIDRAVLGGVETLTRQRPLENMISRLTVRCPHHGREDGRPAKRPRRSQPDDGPSEPQAGDGSDGDGCGWTGKLSERAAHLADECEFARKLCTHQGCGQRVPVAEVAAHAVACEYRPVACEHCGQSRQARALNIHKNVCPRAPVDCPYKGCGCSARVLRGGINQHLTEFAREHAKMTAEKLTLLATKVEHKMTWTVGGIAAKARAGDKVHSPELTLDVGSPVDLGVYVKFTTHDDEQYIGVFVGVCSGQAHLMPLNAGGTKIAVEATTAVRGQYGLVDNKSTRLNHGALDTTYHGKIKLLKVNDFVGDSITITVDWMIERKGTTFTTA